MASPLSKRLFDRAALGHRRPCHWVFKVGSLKQTLQFYQRVFGMKIHRNEEFDEGCEATCNGPYAGKWTKCMVGWGTEDINFALELTYNFGVTEYQQGNDLRYIAVRNDGFEHRAKLAGVEVVEEKGQKTVQAPDGYRYLLVDTDQGVPHEPFLFVSLHVENLARSKAFYIEVLGAQVFEGIPGSLGGDRSVVMGFAKSAKTGDMRYDTMKLELVELGAPVDHKDGIGRLAVGCDKGCPQAMAAKVKAGGGKVVHGPLILEPHKEDLVIVADPDGYEFCFIVDDTFCITGGAPFVDWKYREKLHSAAVKSARRQKLAADKRANTSK